MNTAIESANTQICTDIPVSRVRHRWLVSGTGGSGVTRTLGANIEALFLTGTTAINGTGNTLANWLRGNSANNTLTGDGADILTGNTGRELHIGGIGNDTINTNTGADIIAFNRGDGQDIVAVSTGADNTVSLGGAIAYADLTFTKTGNDLILNVGTGDRITFTGWYTATANRSVINLQIVAEAMAGFNLGGSNPLLNNRIEQFSFTSLAAAFDAARIANPALTTWALSNALNAQLVGGSDTAAYGGDLAYQYGRNGTLASVAATAANTTITDAQFAIATQTFTPGGSAMNVGEEILVARQVIDEFDAADGSEVTPLRVTNHLLANATYPGANVDVLESIIADNGTKPFQFAQRRVIDAVAVTNPQTLMWAGHSLIRQYLAASDAAAMGGEMWQFNELSNVNEFAITPTLGISGSSSVGARTHALRAMGGLLEAAQRVA